MYLREIWKFSSPPKKERLCIKTKRRLEREALTIAHPTGELINKYAVLVPPLRRPFEIDQPPLHIDQPDTTLDNHIWVRTTVSAVDNVMAHVPRSVLFGIHLDFSALSPLVCIQNGFLQTETAQSNSHIIHHFVYSIARVSCPLSLLHSVLRPH